MARSPVKLSDAMITEEQFNSLLPFACAWAEKQEQIILRDGVPLNATQLADAKTIGVLHPEKVRLLKVLQIPLPDDPLLRDAAEQAKVISRDSVSQSLRYGIFIREDGWGIRTLVFHELVHTSQYERLGGFEPFIRQYFYECLTVGYPAAPLEQEAVKKTLSLCT